MRDARVLIKMFVYVLAYVWENSGYGVPGNWFDPHISTCVKVKTTAHNLITQHIDAKTCGRLIYVERMSLSVACSVWLTRFKRRDNQKMGCGGSYTTQYNHGYS